MEASKRLQEVTDLANSLRGLPAELQENIFEIWSETLNRQVRRKFQDKQQLDRDRLYQRYKTHPNSNPWYWDPKLNEGLSEIFYRKQPTQIWSDLRDYDRGWEPKKK